MMKCGDEVGDAEGLLLLRSKVLEDLDEHLSDIIDLSANAVNFLLGAHVHDHFTCSYKKSGSEGVAGSQFCDSAK
jgi:hypothetical protein